MGAAADFLRRPRHRSRSRLWSEPEADQFAADRARRWACPDEKILIENASTNTGENILFTQKLLAARGIDPRTFIVVQKPYMERRSFATFRKLWPEPDVIVTSPKVTLDEYLAGYPTMRSPRTRSSASWSATSSGFASIPPGGSRFPRTCRPRSGTAAPGTDSGGLRFAARRRDNGVRWPA